MRTLTDIVGGWAESEERRDKTRAHKQCMMQELLTSMTRLVSSQKETA